MASSSSSNVGSEAAADLSKDWPEWRRTLYAIEPENRSRSQRDLIRSLELLNKIGNECRRQPPLSLSDIDRVLIVSTGYLEIQMLGLDYLQILQIYKSEETYLLNAKKFIASENFRSAGPLLEFPFAIDARTMPRILLLFSELLMTQNNQASEFLQACMHPDLDEKEKARNLLDCAAGWSLWKSGQRWQQLKVANADELLKKLGSKLTLDKMERCADALITISKIADCLLAPNPTQKMVPMLETVAAWAEELADCPEVDYFMCCYARLIYFPVWAKSEPIYLAQMGLTPSAALGNQIEQTRAVALTKMARLFGRELDAVKASIPQDHALIAVVYSFYANYWTNTQAGGLSVEERQKLIKESKEAVKECKRWLPPGYYKPLKFGVDFEEDTLKEYVEKGGIFRTDTRDNVEIMEKRSLEACCSVCCISGREKPLQLCAQCRKVYYCSKECQKKDWKMHKKVCKPVRAAEKE